MADLFVPLSVNTADDPKIIRSGPFGELLYYRSLQHAKRLLSDGHIDVVHLPTLCRGMPGKPAKHAAVLVVEGLWAEDGTGWRITAWLKRNKPKAVIEAARETKARAGLKGNHVRHHVNKGEFDPSCEFCLADCDDVPSHPASDDLATCDRHSEVKSESESEGSEVATSHDDSRSVPRGGQSDPGRPQSSSSSIDRCAYEAAKLMLPFAPDVRSASSWLMGTSRNLAYERADEITRLLETLDVVEAAKRLVAAPEPIVRAVAMNPHADCERCDGTGVALVSPGPDPADPEWRGMYGPCTDPTSTSPLAVVTELRGAHTG